MSATRSDVGEAANARVGVIRENEKANEVLKGENQKKIRVRQRRDHDCERT